MSVPIEEQLAALEAEAERSGHGAAAQVLNRAGDVCLAAGLRDRALAFYGRAIDANLHGHRPEAAIGLCHKLLRIAPTAVRTRCTLAWLAIGRGDVAEAVREVADYVDAAIDASQRERAARHLALMAEATDSGVVRELIAALLERLGRPDEARHVLDSARSVARDGTAEDARAACWAKVIEGALAGPAPP